MLSPRFHTSPGTSFSGQDCVTSGNSHLISTAPLHDSLLSFPFGLTLSLTVGGDLPLRAFLPIKETVSYGPCATQAVYKG